jgi:hypothetical protein
MGAQQINRVSTIGLTVLSLTALAPLLFVALPAMLTGHVPPPEADEGTAAHIFQLSIVALLPAGFVFLATADWTQPVRSVRRLAFPAVAVVLAFGMLFYFEHVYLPAHGLPPPRPGLPLLLLRQLLAARNQ